MTLASLLGWIVAALLLQLAAGVSIILVRWRGTRVGPALADNPAALENRQCSLIRGEVLPFLLAFTLLALAALLIDALLHLADAVWIGRYLGIPGTLLIMGSFGYSLRKRKLIRSGNAVRLLRLHERLAWLGSLLILVHAGIHFNSILGWLAVWAMLVNICSGLTGKFLLERSRKRLSDERKRMIQDGVSSQEIEERLHRDSVTLDVIKQWRQVHFPITIAFAVLSMSHIVSVFLFWGWK